MDFLFSSTDILVYGSVNTGHIILMALCSVLMTSPLFSLLILDMHLSP